MTYLASDERAEEHRSSAYTLLIIGGLGTVSIVLFFFDILPFKMVGFSKYMISGVMGALFILFLVMGLLSMKSSRLLAVKAGKEKNLGKEIKAWCRENIQASEIDRAVFTEDGDDELGEEDKYFRRAERINEILSNQFLNLEEGYLEGVVDDVYEEIFASNENGRAD
jgi:hypothetical protein